jgi:hypothetical protein
MPILGIIASSYNVVVPNSYESISTVTVGSGGTSSISFTSIPSTYAHLQIRAIGKTSDTADNGSNFSIQLNGSGMTYQHFIRADGGGSVIGSSLSSSGFIGYAPASLSSATDTFGPFVVDILDYANTTTTKTVRSFNGYDTNSAGNALLGLYSTFQNSTSAVSSITITAQSSRTILQYSSFALYGIKGV